MTIHLQPLVIGQFVPNIDCVPLWENSWKIYNLVIDGHPAHNRTYEDIKDLDAADRKVARNAFINFRKFTISGEPFEKLFNYSQCHTGHEFDYKGLHHKIPRMWFGGNVRIYYFNLPNKEIVILKTYTKRNDDLTKKQQNTLEEIAKSFIDCVNANKIVYMKEKNG